jgi:cysteine desulfuration protein SufE
MTIHTRLQTYVDILNGLSDNHDKFLWIMDFGKKSKKMDKELKMKSFEVPGCQSQTWLVPHFIDDKIYFSADSAALISKGMVCLLADVFSGSTGNEITSFDTTELKDLNLSALLTPGRNNGVHSMLKKIQYYAKAPS